MRRTIRFLLLLTGLLQVPVILRAADRSFPYEAVVDVDEELVRSGSGPRFYPTGKLHRGDHVTVHRHDPGGWSMIAPPADSFTYIAAEAVEPTGDGLGIVRENNTVTYVGSRINDSRNVIQRRLSKGDHVQLLDLETLNSDRGPQKLYRIMPPSHEYRWVAGRALVPVETDGPLLLPLDPPRRELSKPDAKPVAAASSSGGSVSPSFESGGWDGPTLPSSDSSSSSSNRPKSGRNAASRGSTPGVVRDDSAMNLALSAVDTRFRDMVQNEPGTWQLDAISTEYDRLAGQFDSPRLERSIQQRRASIDRYRKVKADYDDFMGIVNQGRQRDAELAAMASGPAANTSTPPGGNITLAGAQDAKPNQGVVNIPTTASAPAGMSPTPPAMGTPSMGPAGTNPQQPGPSLTNLSPTNPQMVNQGFVGAGIVQPVNGGNAQTPAYALMTPQGQFLAYLQPTAGVNLASFVGHPVGVQGTRITTPALRADVITVQAARPVSFQMPPTNIR